MAAKLSRYLNWMGYACRVYNVGEYRRRMFGTTAVDADFFDPTNVAAARKLEECGIAALKDALAFFKSGGNAAIYDGTNTTHKRRSVVVDYLKKFMMADGSVQVELVWVEAICDDEQLVERNIREAKVTSPDYVNMTPEQAVRDYSRRIAFYKQHYETLPLQCEEPYIKLIDQGRQVVTNRISGFLMGKLTFYLMNLRINHAPIYLTRHGESMHNLKGWLGGDSPLTERGCAYARGLATFIHQQFDLRDPHDARKINLNAWCSTLQRTVETCTYLGLPFTQWRALSEISTGLCDNMTYKEIEEKYPDEYLARKKDKLNYRYPQGESYMDVVQRLEPVIFEMERLAGPVLVVCHRAVARCLYSYFCDLAPETIPHIDIPLHTIIKLQPGAYGCQVTKTPLNIPSVEDAGVETSS